MLFAVLLLLPLVLTAASIASVFALTSRRRRAALARDPASLPPVTVLKPLCGADDDLEANLETFFHQTHPHYELVFGVAQDAAAPGRPQTLDPAVAVVHRLMARHPEVPARLILHDGALGLNPKVANLRAMLPTARHDLIVISDSNIAVPQGWLANLTAAFTSDPGHGLVLNPFVGTGEETLGATLENLHLAGPIAGSLAVSHELMAQAGVVGKSAMFSRAAFDALGGFESVSSVLAEDYVMGRMFAEAGYKVRLAPTLVDNVCAKTTVRRFFARQLRWGLIRSRIMPLSYPFEPLASPMFPALLAPFAGAYAGAVVTLAVAATLLRDGLQWTRLRGPRGLLAALPLGPLKELSLIGLWLVAPFFGKVSWRGKQFRVATGTRLYAGRERREHHVLGVR
ncbi:MAG: glycosyltransferase [Deltaproteobacteria bacterium]|nr:glycosyltransferase [Deltaproteobacteria bacterium]